MIDPSLEGRVVWGIDHGDNDRIVHIVHPSEGRVSVIARRVRSGSSRQAGVFEVGNRVRVQRSKQLGGIWSIKDAEIVASVRRPREDIARLALLSWACEWTHTLVGPEVEAARSVELLERLLGLLEEPGRPGMGTRLAFEAKALTFAGIGPQLVRCARCGLGFEAEETLVFDHDGGGAAHGGCGTGEAVSRATLFRLEALRRTPLADTLGLDGLAAPSRWLLARFASYQTGWNWRSEAVLAEVEEVR